MDKKFFLISLLTLNTFSQEVAPLKILTMVYITKNLYKFSDEQLKKLPQELVVQLSEKFKSLFVINLEEPFLIKANFQILDNKIFNHFINADEMVVLKSFPSGFGFAPTFLAIYNKKSIATYKNQDGTLRLDKDIKLYATDMDSTITCFGAHPNIFNSFAIGHENGQVNAYNLENNNVERKHWHHTAPVHLVGYDDSGNYVISYDATHQICLWNIDKKYPVAYFKNGLLDSTRNTENYYTINYINSPIMFDVRDVPMRFFSYNISPNERLLLLCIVAAKKRKKMKNKSITAIQQQIEDSTFEDLIKKHLNIFLIDDTSSEDKQEAIFNQLRDKFIQIKGILLGKLNLLSKIFTDI